MKNFEFIDQIVQSPQWETEWVDLLAQLEYVGYRKIAKSVRFEHVNLDVIQHASEEALHSFLLKRAAVSRGLNKDRPWVENPLSAIGWEYFRSLDKALSEDQKQSDCYPLVSWAIEQRVLHLYPYYIEKTRDANVQRALKQILAQEQRHGSQFDEQMSGFDVGIKERALETEQTLWDSMVAQLSECQSRFFH